jgi:2-alkyl-3-oxoalkanoate reductase
VRNSTIVQQAINLVPAALKQQLKRSPTISPPQPLAAPIAAPPVVDEMMSILQRSSYQLPWSKAEQILGYQPLVSFPEGCERSISWLAELDRFRPLLKSPLTGHRIDDRASAGERSG